MGGSFNCRKCGNRWTSEHNFSTCPACGGYGLRHKACICPHNRLGIGGIFERRDGTNPTCPVHGPNKTAGIFAAPAGKIRVFHIDARDHTPTKHGDFPSIEEIRKSFDGMMEAQLLEMRAFDDKGQPVPL